VAEKAKSCRIRVEKNCEACSPQFVTNPHQTQFTYTWTRAKILCVILTVKVWSKNTVARLLVSLQDSRTYYTCLRRQ